MIRYHYKESTGQQQSQHDLDMHGDQEKRVDVEIGTHAGECGRRSGAVGNATIQKQMKA